MWFFLTGFNFCKKNQKPWYQLFWFLLRSVILWFHSMNLFGEKIIYSLYKLCLPKDDTNEFWPWSIYLIVGFLIYFALQQYFCFLRKHFSNIVILHCKLIFKLYLSGQPLKHFMHVWKTDVDFVCAWYQFDYFLLLAMIPLMRVLKFK